MSLEIIYRCAECKIAITDDKTRFSITMLFSAFNSDGRYGRKSMIEKTVCSLACASKASRTFIETPVIGAENAHSEETAAGG